MFAGIFQRGRFRNSVTCGSPFRYTEPSLVVKGSWRAMKYGTTWPCRLRRRVTYISLMAAFRNMPSTLHTGTMSSGGGSGTNSPARPKWVE
jgi:hypothetical protein